MLVVATVWGAWLALATAVASALAFNFFHIPPTGRFTIATGENWVALAVFFLAAVGASSLAEVARQRALEADERRQEADLSAEMARLLLRGGRLEDDPAERRRAARRSARACRARRSSCARSTRGERSVVFALREGTRQIGTLVLPAGAPEAVLRRVQVRSRPRWRRCWPRRWSATRCRPRWSRPPRCAAPT